MIYCCTCLCCRHCEASIAVNVAALAVVLRRRRRVGCCYQLHARPHYDRRLFNIIIDDDDSDDDIII